MAQRPLLALCATPKIALRDGWTGENAKLILPGYDTYWFADGKVPTFPESTLPQDNSRTVGGTTKPNTFKKDCCSCL